MKKLILTVFMIMVFNSTVSAANKYINMILTYDYQKHNYNAEEVFIEVNGTKLTNLTMPPIILNNYTLVPAREVFEAIGAKVDWKKDTEQVYVTYEDTLVLIPVNSRNSYVNGNIKQMDIEAKIINGKTMIPLRFVSNALSFNVEWDPKTRTASIIAKKSESAEAAADIQKAETVTAPTTAEQTNYSIENMYFDNDALYIKNADNNINLTNITEYDRYEEHKYIVEIMGDLSSYIKNTSLNTNGEYIKSCDINAEGSKTTITFTENKIMALEIFNSDEYICFKAVSPKKKYDKIVIIDPGHGGDKPGAIANDLVEKDLTLKMALSVKQRLDSDGRVKCYMTRLDDTDISLEDRAALANDIGGDMFISIHINSADSSEAHGTETYALYPNDLGNGLISYAIAEEMLNQLLEKLGTADRKVKSNTYVVLEKNNIPAALLEIGFISNADEAEMMNNSADKVGQAVFDGIINLFNKYPSVR